MKGFFFLIFFLCTAAVLCAQGNAGTYNRGNSKTSQSIIESWKESDYEKIKNAYYLNPDWASFDLFLKSGCLLEGQLMRLNLFTNQFEVKFGSKIKVLESDKVEYFEFNHYGKVRLFESVNGYGVEKGFEKGFFEVIVSGDPGLLEKIFLGNPQILIAKSSSINKKSHKLSKYKRHFLYHDGRLSQIPVDKKQLYSFFGNNEAEVREYIKKHRLNIHDADDLKELILFLKSEKQLEIKKADQ